VARKALTPAPLFTILVARGRRAGLLIFNAAGDRRARGIDVTKAGNMGS